MIRSMTGFGEAERATPAGTLLVEVRTVNHRHFNANLRLPSSLGRWENDVREWLRSHLARGHANCSIRIQPLPGDPAGVGLRLDGDRVQAYLALLGELRDTHGVRGEPDLALVARFPDVIVREAPDDGPAVDAADLRAAVEDALRQNVEMREEEGRRLQVDLEGRLAALESALGDVERLAPERLVAERNRLRAAIAELVEGVAVPDERIAQEVAFLAERWDVNEELVRFRSHIDLFRGLLAADPEEPVGKRLGFLVQEMHREANTIGSKANHAAIAHRVVSMKEEVERLREQVENVE